LRIGFRCRPGKAKSCQKTNENPLPKTHLPSPRDIDPQYDRKAACVQAILRAILDKRF
jgi:hypothetical protein